MARNPILQAHAAIAARTLRAKDSPPGPLRAEKRGDSFCSTSVRERGPAVHPREGGSMSIRFSHGKVKNYWGG